MNTNKHFRFGIKNIGAIISPTFNLNDISPQYDRLKRFQNGFSLSHIPPLERRRLGNATKCAFSIINDFTLKPDTFIIFSSPSGEINRCFGLLSDLRDNFLISPTTFSLSVLNATPAIIAILLQNTNEISAISANPSLEYGILNAYTKMRENNANEALVLSYYEDIDEGFEAKNAPYYMIALVLSLNDERINATIEIDNIDKKTDIAYSDFAFLAHLQAMLDSDKNIAKWQFSANNTTWKWCITNDG